MDLYIKITNENGDELEQVNIYQDGSDAEGAKEIREWLEDNYSTDPTTLKFSGNINWEARDDQTHEHNQAHKGVPPEGHPRF